MPAFKDCPACGATVAADRSRCGCGHDFTAKASGKKKAPPGAPPDKRPRGAARLALVIVGACAAVVGLLAFPASTAGGVGVVLFLLYLLARRVEDLAGQVLELRAELRERLPGAAGDDRPLDP